MDLDLKAQRQQAITHAIALPTKVSFVPLEAPVQALPLTHLLYRSQARYPLSAGALSALLEQAQRRNQAQHVTGLLCYSSTGQFVQVLEGAAADVHAVFARIQQDARHQHLQVVCERPSATRWFAAWYMAFVEVASREFYWILDYLEAREHNLVKPQLPIDSPPLEVLLDAFSTL